MIPSKNGFCCKTIKEIGIINCMEIVVINRHKNHCVWVSTKCQVRYTLCTSLWIDPNWTRIAVLNDFFNVARVGSVIWTESKIFIKSLFKHIALLTSSARTDNMCWAIWLGISFKTCSLAQFKPRMLVGDPYNL